MASPIRAKSEKVRAAVRDARSVRVPGRAPGWAVPSVRLGLVLSDCAIAGFVFVISYVLRQNNPVFAPGEGWRWSEDFAPYGALLLFVLPIRPLVNTYFNLYRVRGEFSFVEEAINILKATAIGSLLIVAVAFLYRGGFEFRAYSYARGVFLLDLLLVSSLLLALRFVIRSIQIFLRQQGINLIPTLVVGRGKEAANFIDEVKARPTLGYRVIGVVDSDEAREDAPSEFEGIAVIGQLDSLPTLIKESGANEVVITDLKIPGDALFQAMMGIGRGGGIEFRVAPSLFNCLPRKTEIDQIGAMPVITLFREPLSSAARIAKRASDIAIAGLAVALLSPLWLFVAILIRLDSKGAIFYKQERVGMDGRVFLFYKFRSMRTDADDRTHREYQRRYIKGSADANLGDEVKPAYKLTSDSRVTRVGRVLRRLSLDELPQLVNVLRGDMSIVGPRPPIPYEVEAYEVWHRKRLDMKPGLTGLWQVSGRNRLTFDEMVRLDLYYIENWSLLLDLKIILQTLPVMLRGDDAY